MDSFSLLILFLVIASTLQRQSAVIMRNMQWV